MPCGIKLTTFSVASYRWGRMSPPNLEADEKSETGSACTRQAETCYEV